METKIKDLGGFKIGLPEEEARAERAVEDVFKEKIEREKREAKEKFSSLINLVNERYNNSDLARNPDQLKCFKEHNEDILNLCIERGIQREMNEKELKMLEVAAILHDLNKGDNPPDDKKDIPNYVLAIHGDNAAEEAKKILERNEGVLKEILGEEYTDEDKEKAINTVSNAIRSHMGPHPGFMDFILNGANAKLKEKGEEAIEHPYPEEGNIVAEVLLAADMRSLAGNKGREKVLAIRGVSEFFQDLDRKTCKEYNQYLKSSSLGEITMGEAALLSGFDSAEQARDMIKNEGDRKWVGEAIEKSKKEPYRYSYFIKNNKGEMEKVLSEPLRWEKTIAKRAEYLKKKNDKTSHIDFLGKKNKLLDQMEDNLRMGKISNIDKLQEEILQVEENMRKAQERS